MTIANLPAVVKLVLIPYSTTLSQIKDLRTIDTMMYVSKYPIIDSDKTEIFLTALFARFILTDIVQYTIKTPRTRKTATQNSKCNGNVNVKLGKYLNSFGCVYCRLDSTNVPCKSIFKFMFIYWGPQDYKWRVQ